jgi:signal transduction histidine kinase/ligand-binding sensor domain-containing protein
MTICLLDSFYSFLSRVRHLSICAILSFILFIPSKSLFAQLQIHTFLPGSLAKSDSPTDNQNKFEHYSMESGLSSDLVFQILKDRYGFLWFATQNGLNKFNAYNFEIYENDPQDENSISLNDVSSLCEYEGNIWAGTWGGGLNKFNRINNFSHYYSTQQDPHSLSNNKIQTLFRDHNNILWISTQSGVDKFNPVNASFEHFLTNKKTFKIIEDCQYNLYFASIDGLYILGNDRKSIHQYELPANLLAGKSDTNKIVTTIFIDKNNTIWVGTQKGFFQFDVRSGKFNKLNTSGYSFSSKDARNIFDKANISSIFKDSFGDIWIGTRGQGLYRIDDKIKKITDFRSYLKDPYSTFNYSINDLNEDNSNQLWVATNHGVFKLNLNPPKFHAFSFTLEDKKIVSFAPAYSFLTDGEENLPATQKHGNKTLWVGTINGINKFDLDSRKCTYIPLPTKNNSGDAIVFTNILKDNSGNLWFGTNMPGIHVYNPIQKQFIEGKGSYIFTNKLKDIFINQILMDNENCIWLSSNAGLYRFNTTTKSWSVYYRTRDNNSLSDNNLRTLYKDKEGILWISTIDNGLNRFDYKKNIFTHFRYHNKDQNSLSNDYINFLCDDDLYVWAGTPSGLNRIDKKTLECKRYTLNNSLASQYICGFLSDKHHNLWISTNKGISLFNTLDNSVLNFDSYESFTNNAFIHRSDFKSPSGDMFFGNGQGFISFNPDSIKFNNYVPPVYLTNISVMGKNKILSQNLEDLKEVTINYNEDFIQFEFTGLDYTSPLKIHYKYKLDGFDNSWISTGNRRFASYTNLKSGTYVFRVIASNEDGRWNTNGLALKVIVVPPYWQTFWFKLLVSILILLIVFVLHKIKVKDIEKREKMLEVLNKQLLTENEERQKAELEMRKAKETAENADRLKSEFLAQISHEIRTPVNAILSFSGLIREEATDKFSDDMINGFSIIDRASKRLIRTVDLILNMALLQTETFELNFQSFDLYNKIIEKKIREYSIWAEEKNLGFNTILETNDYLIYADETTVEQIFDNLFNNAVKFTKKGEVGIRIFRDELKGLVIEVFDTGVGISEEYLPNLFTPFSQEEGGYSRRFEGNGLGLALIKKYVELNKASIQVKSEKGKGSSFIITFPKYQ